MRSFDIRSFVYFISYLHFFLAIFLCSCCSCAQVGTTFVHEFHRCYCHEQYGPTWFMSDPLCRTLCGTCCHMASTFMPHSRTATATICSTSRLLLLGFTLSHSFHFYCWKRLLSRNNTATASAPHRRCQHLPRVLYYSPAV